jgi:hypothetical protein
MMASLLKALRLTSWCVAALMTAALVAQSSPQVGPDAKKACAASAPPWLQKTIRFSDEKVNGAAGAWRRIWAEKQISPLRCSR